MSLAQLISCLCDLEFPPQQSADQAASGMKVRPHLLRGLSTTLGGRACIQILHFYRLPTKTPHEGPRLGQSLFSDTPGPTHISAGKLGEQRAAGSANHAEQRGRVAQWQVRTGKEAEGHGGGDGQLGLCPGLDESPPKVKLPAEGRPTAHTHSKGRGFEAPPSPGGPKLACSFFSESGRGPFKAFGKATRWKRTTAGEARRVLSVPASVGRAGARAGRGKRRRGQRSRRAPRGPVTASFPQRPRRAGHSAG